MNLLTIIVNKGFWHLLNAQKLTPQTQKQQKQPQRNWGFTFYGETPSALRNAVNIVNSQESTVQIGRHGELGAPPHHCPEDGLASFPLAIARICDRLCILHLNGSPAMQRYLMNLGLFPGEEIQVVSLTDSGSVIIAIDHHQLGLSANQTHQIIVTKNNLMNHQPTKIERSPAKLADFHNQKPNPIKAICLGDLAQGCKGRVMGYNNVTRGYKGKLLAMGLTPGTEFAITRYAPLGDPVEIRVRGFSLSLRKHEANALLVEEVCA